MFFSDASEIKNIASKTGCAVFVVPDNMPVEIKNAIIVEPTDKSIISMDDIRDLLLRLGKKQKNDLFIIIAIIVVIMKLQVVLIKLVLQI